MSQGASSTIPARTGGRYRSASIAAFALVFGFFFSFLAPFASANPRASGSRCAKHQALPELSRYLPVCQKAASTGAKSDDATKNLLSRMQAKQSEQLMAAPAGNFSAELIRSFKQKLTAAENAYRAIQAEAEEHKSALKDAATKSSDAVGALGKVKSDVVTERMNKEKSLADVDLKTRRWQLRAEEFSTKQKQLNPQDVSYPAYGKAVQEAGKQIQQLAQQKRQLRADIDFLGQKVRAIDGAIGEHREQTKGNADRFARLKFISADSGRVAEKIRIQNNGLDPNRLSSLAETQYPDEASRRLSKISESGPDSSFKDIGGGRALVAAEGEKSVRWGEAAVVTPRAGEGVAERTYRQDVAAKEIGQAELRESTAALGGPEGVRKFYAEHVGRMKKLSDEIATIQRSGQGGMVPAGDPRLKQMEEKASGIQKEYDALQANAATKWLADERGLKPVDPKSLVQAPADQFNAAARNKQMKMEAELLMVATPVERDKIIDKYSKMPVTPEFYDVVPVTDYSGELVYAEKPTTTSDIANSQKAFAEFSAADNKAQDASAAAIREARGVPVNVAGAESCLGFGCAPMLSPSDAAHYKKMQERTADQLAVEANPYAAGQVAGAAEADADARTKAKIVEGIAGARRQDIVKGVASLGPGGSLVEIIEADKYKKETLGAALSAPMSTVVTAEHQTAKEAVESAKLSVVAEVVTAGPVTKLIGGGAKAVLKVPGAAVEEVRAGASAFKAGERAGAGRVVDDAVRVAPVVRPEVSQATLDHLRSLDENVVRLRASGNSGALRVAEREAERIRSEYGLPAATPARTVNESSPVAPTQTTTQAPRTGPAARTATQPATAQPVKPDAPVVTAVDVLGPRSTTLQPMVASAARPPAALRGTAPTNPIRELANSNVAPALPIRPIQVEGVNPAVSQIEQNGTRVSAVPVTESSLIPNAAAPKVVRTAQPGQVTPEKTNTPVVTPGRVTKPAANDNLSLVPRRVPANDNIPVQAEPMRRAVGDGLSPVPRVVQGEDKPLVMTAPGRIPATQSPATIPSVAANRVHSPVASIPANSAPRPSVPSASVGPSYPPIHEASLARESRIATATSPAPSSVATPVVRRSGSSATSSVLRKGETVPVTAPLAPAQSLGPSEVLGAAPVQVFRAPSSSRTASLAAPTGDHSPVVVEQSRGSRPSVDSSSSMGGTPQAQTSADSSSTIPDGALVKNPDVRGIDKPKELVYDMQSGNSPPPLRVANRAPASVADEIPVAPQEVPQPKRHQADVVRKSGGESHPAPLNGPSGATKLDIHEAYDLLRSAEAFGNTDSLLADRLTVRGLLPTDVVQTQDGTKYYLSPIFSESRPSVIAVVENKGRKRLQVFYQSGSNGTFRNLPGVQMKEGRITWYDKGKVGESALELPSEVEEAVAQKLIKRRESHSEKGSETAALAAQGENVYLEVVPHFPDISVRDKIQAANPAYQIESRPLLKKPFWGLLSNDNPKRVAIADPQHDVDFSRSPVRTYRTQTRNGTVDAKVFRSRDESIEYTIHEDAEGKIWVAKVEDISAPINAAGLRAKSYDPDKLTMPRWEYPSQIPKGYGIAGAGKTYSDAWPFLREVPFIQNYYRARGLPVPDVRSAPKAARSTPTLPPPTGPPVKPATDVLAEEGWRVNIEDGVYAYDFELTDQVQNVELVRWLREMRKNRQVRLVVEAPGETVTSPILVSRNSDGSILISLGDGYGKSDDLLNALKGFEKFEGQREMLVKQGFEPSQEYAYVGERGVFLNLTPLLPDSEFGRWVEKLQQRGVAVQVKNRDIPDLTEDPFAIITNSDGSKQLSLNAEFLGNAEILRSRLAEKAREKSEALAAQGVRFLVDPLSLGLEKQGYYPLSVVPDRGSSLVTLQKDFKIDLYYSPLEETKTTFVNQRPSLILGDDYVNDPVRGNSLVSLTREALAKGRLAEPEIGRSIAKPSTPAIFPKKAQTASSARADLNLPRDERFARIPTDLKPEEAAHIRNRLGEYGLTEDPSRLGVFSAKGKSNTGISRQLSRLKNRFGVEIRVAGLSAEAKDPQLSLILEAHPSGDAFYFDAGTNFLTRPLEAYDDLVYLEQYLEKNWDVIQAKGVMISHNSAGLRDPLKIIALPNQGRLGKMMLTMERKTERRVKAGARTYPAYKGTFTLREPGTLGKASPGGELKLSEELVSGSKNAGRAESTWLHEVTHNVTNARNILHRRIVYENTGIPGYSRLRADEVDARIANLATNRRIAAEKSRAPASLEASAREELRILTTNRRMIAFQRQANEALRARLKEGVRDRDLYVDTMNYTVEIHGTNIKVPLPWTMNLSSATEVKATMKKILDERVQFLDRATKNLDHYYDPLPERLAQLKERSEVVAKASPASSTKNGRELASVRSAKIEERMVADDLEEGIEATSSKGGVAEVEKNYEGEVPKEDDDYTGYVLPGDKDFDEAGNFSPEKASERLSRPILAQLDDWVAKPARRKYFYVNKNGERIFKEHTYTDNFQLFQSRGPHATFPLKPGLIKENPGSKDVMEFFQKNKIVSDRDNYRLRLYQEGELKAEQIFPSRFYEDGVFLDASGRQVDETFFLKLMKQKGVDTKLEMSLSRETLDYLQLPADFLRELREGARAQYAIAKQHHSRLKPTEKFDKASVEAYLKESFEAWKRRSPGASFPDSWRDLGQPLSSDFLYAAKEIMVKRISDAKNSKRYDSWFTTIEKIETDFLNGPRYLKLSKNTRLIKSSEITGLEESSLRKLAEAKVKIKAEPSSVKNFLKEQQDIGEVLVLPDEAGAFTFGRVIEVEQFPDPLPKGTPFTIFYQHPDFPKYLEQLKRDGVEVVFDFSSGLASNGGYFSTINKVIGLHADSTWHSFLHEFQHAEFFRDAEPILRDGKLIRGGKLINALTPEQIQRIGLDKVKFMQKLLDRGVGSSLALNEGLSVLRELESFGWKQYMFGSRTASAALFARKYALSFQIAELTEMPQRTAGQNLRLAKLRAKSAFLSTLYFNSAATEVANSLTRESPSTAALLGAVIGAGTSTMFMLSCYREDECYPKYYAAVMDAFDDKSQAFDVLYRGYYFRADGVVVAIRRGGGYDYYNSRQFFDKKERGSGQ